METPKIYEKPEVSETEESLQLAQNVKDDLVRVAQEALNEINVLQTETGSRLSQESAELDERESELSVVQKSLAKWEKTTELKNRWKNEGTVAQGLIAEHLLSRWQQKYEKEYRALKEAFDQKWNKE